MFGRRDVADGPHQAAIVEPVYPFERGGLDSFERSSGATSVNQLDLVKAIDRFGERIVVRITDAATEGSMPASAIGLCT